jgi:SPP1 family predicted phage head-tail adaptor
MLPAGLFNKIITMQHLKKVKDDYGSEVETWVDEITCKCRVVTPSMADNRKALGGEEVVISDRCIFQMRKYFKKHFDKYSGLKHRIMYRNKLYQILGMDDENDELIIIAEYSGKDEI